MYKIFENYKKQKKYIIALVLCILLFYLIIKNDNISYNKLWILIKKYKK